MKVTPATSANAIRKRLLKLISECDSFQMATAWATESDVMNAATGSDKLERLVIGTHQYFTSPEILQRCLGMPEVRYVPPKGPMFHPKLYTFDLSGQVEIFLGSANLTKGGLANNIECGAFIKGEADSPALAELRRHVQTLWKGGKKLDQAFVSSYEANHRRVRDAKRELEEFTEIKSPVRSGHSANDVSPQSMDWNGFFKLVKKDEKYGLKERLLVLSLARGMFAKNTSFAKLSEMDRKSIAGLLGPSSRQKVDWGYFGQMTAFGGYSPAMQKHANLFSSALDEIPLQGSVRRKHFEAYLKAFKKVPGASETWTGMGTRLLAMKRPDHFVCIDGANKKGLCNYFGVAPSTTNLDNYWDRIIAPMMLTPWWQADMPSDEREKEVWMGRAAMLDAIYYDPDER